MGNCIKTSKERQITGIIIGCGDRGQIYAEYARYFPKYFRIIAIAEPRLIIREKFQRIYSIDSEYIFHDWHQLISSNIPRIADCVLITLPDSQHYDAVKQFANKGYHILLEKPMATKLEHCKEIVQICDEKKLLLAVCHVLRYLPVVKKIKQLLDENVIGKLVSIQHTEPIGFWHFAHSYVRGNWHNEKESCFSFLTKCCHDIDLIQYWMQPRQCTHVSSFGKLTYFTRENKPENAGERCLNCSIESTCPYSAKKIYLDIPNTDWPVSTVVPDIEDCNNWNEMKNKIIQALETGPYGKCVYGDCNNDVVDQQVVLLNFDDGSTATIQMIAFSERISQRISRLFGTHGELTWNGDDKIIHFDFLTKKRTIYNEIDRSIINTMNGHNGADFFAIDSFIRALVYDQSELIGTGPKDSLISHILAFAAEKSRKENRVCEIKEFLFN